ncbi:MAG: GTPase ObgE, partial [Bdellovibrionota bacterium]
MRFIDEATIRLFGGHGGPGCISFRRETFVPRGGPDGGDGGEGADVILVASTQISSLQDFRYKREYRADNGKPGSSTNKAGRDGVDVEIRVPVGTVIKDVETGELLVDFTEQGQRWVAVTGGRGGKGNAHFVTSTFQAPKFAQPGEEGTSREIKLELKLLADVGIIGFPNAGKSTLISRISAAKPKIADYPFTTLTPNLGVVQVADHHSFVVADIPGLIEGAHRGAGLGHKFLKHIERTALFVHLLDGTKLLEDATAAGDDSFDRAIEALVERYQVIRNELGLFNEGLLHKPEIVVLNKLDVLESDPALVERARTALRQRLNSIRGVAPVGKEPYVVSAVSGTGINELVYAVWDQVKA